MSKAQRNVDQSEENLSTRDVIYLLGLYLKEIIRILKFKFVTNEIQSWHRPQKAINFCSKLVNDQRISNNYFCLYTVAKSFLLKPSKYLILNLKFVQAEMKPNGCLKHYGHISMMSSRFWCKISFLSGYFWDLRRFIFFQRIYRQSPIFSLVTKNIL